MKRTVLAAALAATMTACTAVTATNDAPQNEWISSRELDDATACLIAGLDAANPDLPFAAGIKVPGQIYEVRPTKAIMVGGDPIVVRMQRAESGTKISLYAVGRLGIGVRPSIEACL